MDHQINHVAIIMDGNGRWAKSRMLPRLAGHRAGAEAARRITEAAAELGIGYLTLYSFSAENWDRPKDEIAELMDLLRRYLKSETATLHEKNIRLRIIGDRTKLDKDIIELIENAEKLTQANTKLTLVMALSYGGRQEIVEATKKLVAAAQSGEIDAAAIDMDSFAEALYAPDMPDPDLIIRTSGEQRISNFLLWQSAYSEFYFTDKHWPDFDKNDLIAALSDFKTRERRYGKVI